MSPSSTTYDHDSTTTNNSSRRRRRRMKNIALFVVGIVFLVICSMIDEGRSVRRISILTMQQQQQPLPPPSQYVMINAKPSKRSSTYGPYNTTHSTAENSSNETVLPLKVAAPPPPPPITTTTAAAATVTVDIHDANNNTIAIQQQLQIQIQQPWNNIQSPRPQTTPNVIKATPTSPKKQQQQPRMHRNITLIVQLRGELGNQLSVMVNARITQLLAQRKYPHIHIHLIGQHQSDSSKWTRGRDDLIQCFPNVFQNFQFDGGMHDTEFHIIKAIQESWLTIEQRHRLTNVRSFHFLDSLLLQQEEQNNNSTSTNATAPPQYNTTTLSSSSAIYSLPYLTATSFSWIDVLRNEWYYNEIREWLLFNYQDCCRNPNVGDGPHRNTTTTTVTTTTTTTSNSTNHTTDTNDDTDDDTQHSDVTFHYRNFATELKHQWKSSSSSSGTKTVSLQFVEISPSVAANVAFMNHTVTSTTRRIAISSRYESGTSEYITAFQDRNISSYFVTGLHSGTEGFCYLLQTSNELFGSYQSTYYRWATLLGNTKINRFYIIGMQPPIGTTTTTTTTDDIPGMNSTINVETTENETVVQPPRSSDADAVRTTMETIRHGNRTFIIEVYRQ